MVFGAFTPEQAVAAIHVALDNTALWGSTLGFGTLVSVAKTARPYVVSYIKLWVAGVVKEVISN